MSQFKTMPIDWHHQIIHLVKNTGLGLNSKGLCYGGATTAIFAFLRGQESMDGFIDSVNASADMSLSSMTAIESLLQNELESKLRKPIEIKWQSTLNEALIQNPNFSESDHRELRQAFNRSEDIQQLRKKAREDIIAANPEIQMYMDTLALLQNIKVNFNAAKYAHLLPQWTKLRGQQTVIASAKIFQPATSDSIQAQKNTMVIASSACLPHMQEDISKLILNFMKHCDALGSPLALNLIGNKHALSCAYDPHEKRWLLFDMNQQPYYGEASLKEVSDFIWHGLAEYNIGENEKPNPVLILSTEIYTTDFQSEAVKDYYLTHREDLQPKIYTDISEDMLALNLKTAILNGYPDSISTLCASYPEISEKSISEAIDLALSKNKLDALPYLIAASNLSQGSLEEYFQKALQMKDTDQIEIFASSDKIASMTKLMSMMNAINSGETGIVRVLASCFKDAELILETGLTQAILKKNDAAIEAIVSSGGLSKENVQQCLKNYTPALINETNEKQTQAPLARSFIGRAKSVLENISNKVNSMTPGKKNS